MTLTTIAHSEHVAYLIHGDTETGGPDSNIQFAWDDGTNLVLVTFYQNGVALTCGSAKMLKLEARKLWNIMIRDKGYTKGYTKDS